MSGTSDGPSAPLYHPLQEALTIFLNNKKRDIWSAFDSTLLVLLLWYILDTLYMVGAISSAHILFNTHVHVTNSPAAGCSCSKEC